MCGPSGISAGLLKKRKKGSYVCEDGIQQQTTNFKCFLVSVLFPLGPRKDQADRHEMTIEVSKTTFMAYQTPM